MDIGMIKKCLRAFGIACFCVGILFSVYYLIDQAVPSVVCIRAGREESIYLGIPATAQVAEYTCVHEESVEPEDSYNLSREVRMKMEEDESMQLEVRLFGVLPIKQMGVHVIADREVIPLGLPVGLYVETQGVLVVKVTEFTGENGDALSPCKNLLEPGDYICSVDGERVGTKDSLAQVVERSEGHIMLLEVNRGGVMLEKKVTPGKDSEGNYKLGLWVRDNAQGVGTLTYLEDNGRYGALGHGITDSDIGSLMHVAKGMLYETSIVKIKRGREGDPGELTGAITYADDHIIGSIEENDAEGIHGFCDPGKLPACLPEPVPIGLKQEIVKGPAQILCMTDDLPHYYDVEITGIHLEYDKVNRGIELKVTDEELLERTGGIVQGMSGSPILQNGKLVGAVTHVLVNDPTRGYGIFIEKMLQ